ADAPPADAARAGAVAAVPLPRRPAFWLWAAACLAGAWIAWRGLETAVRAFPAGSIAGGALLAPALGAGFWLLRRLHPVRPHPARYALIALAWGGLAAFGLALPANAAFQAVLAETAGPEFGATWGASIA